MKILVFYFSGTGNTWWLINQLRNRIETANNEFEAFSIEKLDETIWKKIQNNWINYDWIGIAYPIYGSDAPKIIYQFIEDLAKRLDFSELPLKNVFVFTTMELFSGDGCLILKKKLKNINLELQIAYNFQMVSNLGIPIFNYNPCSDEKFEKRRKKTLKKLDKIVKKMFSNQKYLKNKWNPISYFIGGLQRIFMHSIEKNNWKLLGVDSSRCTQCLYCVENCPTNSINFENDQFIFSENCTACYRCYNFCPTGAITVSSRSMNPIKHKQHQIYKNKPYY